MTIQEPCCGATVAVNRRRFLAGAATLAGAGLLELAGASMAFAAPGAPATDLLVVVTLRGGADGLSLVPPLADHAYTKARPGIGVRKGEALPLDRFFGLHPRLAPLLPFWQAQSLAIVQAVGDQDGSRSHFTATEALDRGVNASSSVSTGWIDRHLTTRPQRAHAFPAVAIGGQVPQSLQGPAPDLTFPTVDAVRIRVPKNHQAAVERALRQMHTGVAGTVSVSGLATMDVLKCLAPTQQRAYAPRPGVDYPAGELGQALRQVAQLARADVGLEVACVDSGGWDTHTGMGSASGGPMAEQVARFGAALAAFARDLGPLFRTTTIITASEFGRRVAQNASGGVDHGLGNAMLLLGGGVRGGRVYGRWPGLADKDLEQGDLRVTTDQRDVFAEVVRRRLGNSRATEVFPGHVSRELGLVRQR
ncbi:DUF1501 domain-containing protein [Aeromicrobium sp.]|uniref:DUF1501 domain-containing protein n=1 Tax=Aeromicrobium sp. TaxID=1871063 RepID=UPI001985A736|nr:DUF1501 domain-containing protein [Aeromicrobium sp.]MBC7633541.1 DUF1501 domain-containing protein [Aeromicrobium sp.]